MVIEKRPMLPTATPRGLHEFVTANVLARYARSGIRAADLGAGPGAMTERLHALGCEVVPVDRDPSAYLGEGSRSTGTTSQPNACRRSVIAPGQIGRAHV